MIATRLTALPLLFMGLLLNGWVIVALLTIVVLVDVGHKRQWTPAQFAGWLFACSVVFTVALEFALQQR